MKRIELTANKSGRLVKLISQDVDGYGYSAILQAVRKKDVTVNGVRVKSDVSVEAGDQIVIYLPDKAPFRPVVVYEDDKVLILDKPKQIEVCDGDNNMVKALLEIGISVIAVHRLDRNTEGLIIFAKTEEVALALRKGLGEGGATKYYFAEVYGVPKQNRGAFTDYIQKNAAKSEVKVFSSPTQRAEKAITAYEVVSSSGGVSLLSVAISEGKTHQIRASLAHHGLPIIGDGKYGKNEINKQFRAKSQRLRCYKIQFSFSAQSPLYYLNSKKIQLPFKEW